jgi:hypothetical protein
MRDIIRRLWILLTRRCFLSSCEFFGLPIIYVLGELDLLFRGKTNTVD